ncbi:MAG TPA: CD1871A family CXXC motif-containing protein [Feifaniaceae bacterium]|nr:CD1871A family CXXC motif-containing protein [Feifaniaceae bacterium]
MRKRIVPILLLLTAAAFLLLGVYRGEAETVIRKATTVCLECIGIG